MTGFKNEITVARRPDSLGPRRRLVRTAISSRFPSGTGTRLSVTCPPKADRTIRMQSMKSDVMLDQTKTKPCEILEVTGDLRALTDQLAGADGLSDLSTVIATTPVKIDSLVALRQFLQDYSTEVLVGIEVPAIYQAYLHASRYEIRELIALDLRLKSEPGLQRFAPASQHAGAAHLRKLRPLRDQRLVQRYLDAVETGAAFGSHLVVYGMVLFLYSLPLRQGLINYGCQTLRSFLNAGSSPFIVPSADRDLLWNELSRPLPDFVDFILRDCAFPHRSIYRKSTEANKL